jgi:hypothetical protein
LQNPIGLWVSSDGKNVFISDNRAHVVRQVIRSSGIISTITGTTGGVLYYPNEIWGDSIANLFISNSYQVKMLSLSSNILTAIAGIDRISFDSGDGGSPTSATFFGPSSIWGDSNGLFLFISDMQANKIRIIDKSLNIIYTVAKKKYLMKKSLWDLLSSSMGLLPPSLLIG